MKANTSNCSISVVI